MICTCCITSDETPHENCENLFISLPVGYFKLQIFLGLPFLLGTFRGSPFPRITPMIGYKIEKNIYVEDTQ